jgi:hypothetical protein
VHIAILEKKNGEWKIISDLYTDTLWKALRKGSVTIESLLDKLEND